MDTGIFGYYERPDQTTPTFDPGMEALCPFCLRKLEPPVRTTSLMAIGDSRSFFYRAHRVCAVAATPQQEMEIESALIESRTNRERA